MTAIILFITVLLIIFIIDIITRKDKNLKKIRTEWNGKKKSGDFESMESISQFWKNKLEYEKDLNEIDDYTWNDLSLDEVFKKLKYTSTSMGSEKLYSMLRTIDLNGNRIKDNEDFLDELSSDQILREKIQLCLANYGKKDFADTSSYLYETIDKKSMKYSYLYTLLGITPLLSLLFIAYSPKLTFVLFLLSVILNALVYHIKKSEYEKEFYSLAYITGLINCANNLTEIKSDSLFFEKRKQFKKRLKKLKRISFLGKVISYENGSTMEMLLDYFRIFFLIDFIVYNYILRIIKRNQNDYRVVWHFVSDIDTYISIVFFRHKFGDYCVPEFDECLRLKADEVYHPLIENPVKNSLEMNNDILITGSNASGKSTFIKSIAVNSILAQTINTVLAKSFTMKPSYVLTSMAINDDIIQGDSYFIAEIKSLQRIIETIKKGEPCLSFIDEILKGTNTVERVSASAAILKWFNCKENSLTIVASHDIELTEISKGYYDNHHFEGMLQGNVLKFDYKLKSGVSHAKNAIKLLNTLNYPDEIIENSQEISQRFNKQGKWTTFSQI